MAYAAGAFDVEGFVAQKKELDSLLMSNPAMEKQVQKLIRKVLSTARTALSREAKSQMKSDPRQAYKAVKRAVYKRILGGSVSILPAKKRKNGATYSSMTSVLTRQRGGNRRSRSPKTTAIEGYTGSDRAFILLFLNSGTKERVINFIPDSRRERVNRGSRGGNLRKYGKTINTGRRGSISARHWFGNRSAQELSRAANTLQRMIDDLIIETIKKNG